MEMPQGYKRFYKDTDSFRGQLGMDTDKALELLKEMAETLRLVVNNKLNEEYYDKEAGKHDTMSPAWALRARDTLNKFKEWK